jgi:cytochrome c oxidase assembly factor CtaG
MNSLNLSWPSSPGALVVIIVLCLLFGLVIVQARRSRTHEKRVNIWRIVAFVVAIVAMSLALLTPVDTIARTQLFLIHMVQVVTLTTLCAPLLLMAFPGWFLRPFLELPVVRHVARVLTQPVVASLIFNVTFLTWHAPVLFHIAMKQETLYHVEMLSLWFTALLNWWPLIGSVREFRKMSYPLQMLYAFLDGQPVDIYAFLLVFSGVVIYPYYAIPPQLGIPAFSDQAVGGAFLLIPGLVDLIVMSPLFIRWLAQVEERQKIKDQQL